MPKPSSTANASYPVFPLPDFVLFPHVRAPLHIFEPRYRLMVDQALDGSGRFCMATLRPSMDQVSGHDPMFFPRGCLCEIVDYDCVAEGRYNIEVRGLEIVTIAEVSSPHLYRMVEAKNEEESPCEEPSGAAIDKVRFLALELLGSYGVDVDKLEPVFEGLAPEALVNTICFFMPLSGLQKLPLFAAVTAAERCARLADLLVDALDSRDRRPSD